MKCEVSFSAEGVHCTIKEGWVREISKNLQTFLPTAPSWDLTLLRNCVIYEYRVLADNYDDDYFNADVLRSVSRVNVLLPRRWRFALFRMH